MHIKRQMRLFDIYSLYVDNKEHTINMVRNYSIDREHNILSITFRDYSTYEYDIRDYDEKLNAVKAINKMIKQYRGRQEDGI